MKFDSRMMVELNAAARVAMNVLDISNNLSTTANNTINKQILSFLKNLKQIAIAAITTAMGEADR